MGEIKAVLEDVIADLEEAQGFSAMSPCGRENIASAISKIEEIVDELGAGHPNEPLGYVREAGLRSLSEGNHTSLYPTLRMDDGYVIPVYAALSSKDAEISALAAEVERLRLALGKLDGDSLDAMMEVVGEGPEFRRYNQGKSSMREWFLRRINAALAALEQKP